MFRKREFESIVSQSETFEDFLQNMGNHLIEKAVVYDGILIDRVMDFLNVLIAEDWETKRFPELREIYQKYGRFP